MSELPGARSVHTLRLDAEVQGYVEVWPVGDGRFAIRLTGHNEHDEAVYLTLVLAAASVVVLRAFICGPEGTE